MSYVQWICETKISDEIKRRTGSCHIQPSRSTCRKTGKGQDTPVEDERINEGGVDEKEDQAGDAKDPDTPVI
jgi:hypothetical protein